jgi:hypothetical protein
MSPVGGKKNIKGGRRGDKGDKGDKSKKPVDLDKDMDDCKFMRIVVGFIPRLVA